MSFDDKGGDQETTQTTQPWAPAQGQLKDILGQAGGLFGKGQSFLNDRMAGGNPLADQSTGLLSDLLGGNTLDVTNSPAWGSLVGGVQDAVNSQFSAHGRTGSPAHAGVMTGELGKLAGSLWDRERGRQMQGIGMAPGVYNFGNAGLDDLWQNLSRYSGLTSGIAGLGGQTDATTKGGGGGFLGDLFGSIAGIIGLGSDDESDPFGRGGKWEGAWSF